MTVEHIAELTEPIRKLREVYFRLLEDCVKRLLVTNCCPPDFLISEKPEPNVTTIKGPLGYGYKIEVKWPEFNYPFSTKDCSNH